MTEFRLGKHKFYPYEFGRCKETTLKEREELLESLNNDKREGEQKKAKQPQRRDNDAPPADHRIV